MNRRLLALIPAALLLAACASQPGSSPASVADTIARSCAWSRPNLPVAGDPGPFHGTPALAG